MRTIFCPNTYMWFVSAMIHMVCVMCFEEAHQSVNLRENSSCRYLPLFKTNQRERAERGIQSREKSAPLRDGEGGLEQGLRRSLTVEPAFIRYIILLQLHTSIDISSSASHQRQAVRPAYSVSNKINTYTLGVWGNIVTVSWQYLLYVKLTLNSISCLMCDPVEIIH